MSFQVAPFFFYLTRQGDNSPAQSAAGVCGKAGDQRQAKLIGHLRKPIDLFIWIIDCVTQCMEPSPPAKEVCQARWAASRSSSALNKCGFRRSRTINSGSSLLVRRHRRRHRSARDDRTPRNQFDLAEGSTAEIARYWRTRNDCFQLRLSYRSYLVPNQRWVFV
jgi:hypothetical protein